MIKFQHQVLPLVLSAVAYFLMAHLGQLAALPPSNVSLIWPAAGVALGAALIWRTRALPGIFLGCAGFQYLIDRPVEAEWLGWLLPLMLAFPVTLQAAVGAWLTRRWVGFPLANRSPALVMRFLVLVVPLSSLVSSSISCMALWLTGVITADQLLSSGLIWWVGDSIGVIVSVPWLLLLFKPMGQTAVPRRGRVAMGLLLILGTTLWMASVALENEQDKQRRLFEYQGDLMARSLDLQVHSVLNVLYGLAGYVQSRERLTPEAFGHYANPLLARDQGLRGLSWNRVVTANQRERFERRMQRLYPEQAFRINERAPDGTPVTAAQRDKHVVVSYIEPLAANRQALGFDLYSQPDRRAALDLAAARQQAIPTLPVDLEQGRDSESEVLIFYPVYQIGVEQPLLRGYVTAVVDVGALALNAFTDGLAAETGVMLMDPRGGESPEVLYRRGLTTWSSGEILARMVGDHPFALQSQNRIEVGGLHWDLVHFNPQAFITEPRELYLLVGSGFLIAGMLSWFLISVASHTAEIERQVRQRTEELTKSNRLLEASQQVSGMGSWEWHPRNNFSQWSSGLYGLLEYPTSIKPSLSAFLEVVHEEDRQRVANTLRNWHSNLGESGSLQCRRRSGRGVLELHFKRLSGSQGLSIVVRDITQSHDQQEQLKLAAATFESQDAILITDNQLRIQRVNSGFLRLSGFPVHRLIGQRLTVLSPKAHRDGFFEPLLQHREEQRRMSDEAWLATASGEDMAVRISATPVTNYLGTAEHWVVSFHDITAAKEAEKQIQELAYFDPLTRLPNRTRLFQQLEQQLRVVQRRPSPFAVMFLDLDGFKDINDSMGHDVGDHLLCEIAGRIKDGLRDCDFAARLGGDEFCVLTDQLQYDDDAAVIANKLLETVNEPLQLGGNSYMPRVSIGIALYPGDGEDPQTLIKAADTAMYLAKERGKNQYAFYCQALTEQAVERIRFESELRSAILGKALELYFQPQFSLQQRRMVGVEALIRWPHETRGLLYPDRFLPVAERLKLTREIDLWVLDAAAAQLAQWLERTQRPFKVAVNISSSTFQDPLFVTAVRGCLQRYGLPPSSLEFELADARGIRSSAGREHAAQLRQLGVSLAIDNFGSTGSSLVDLTEAGFNTIKMDRSFISTLSRNPQSALLLGAMIGCAQGVGATFVAQGVETLEQVQILHGLDCDLVQGYYFYHPVVADDVMVDREPDLLKHSS